MRAARSLPPGRAPSARRSKQSLSRFRSRSNRKKPIPSLPTVSAPASVITTKQSLSRAIASRTSAASPICRAVYAVSPIARTSSSIVRHLRQVERINRPQFVLHRIVQHAPGDRLFCFAIFSPEASLQLSPLHSHAVHKSHFAPLQSEFHARLIIQTRAEGKTKSRERISFTRHAKLNFYGKQIHHRPRADALAPTNAEENLSRAIEKIREAAARGAQIICMDELFRGEYFCRKEDADLFNLAEPIPGPATEALAQDRAKNEKSSSSFPFSNAAPPAFTTTPARSSTPTAASSANIARCTFPTIRSTTKSFISRLAISVSPISIPSTEESACRSAGISGIPKVRASPRSAARK